MALSPLNWYFVGTRTFGYKPNVFGANEAVWRLGNSGVYADGTARIPGVGSAWTWFNELLGSDVTATYGTPPINPLNMAYLIGGSTSGVAPGSVAANLLTPDAAYAANVTYYGMNRQSGPFVSWAAANPFTAANTFSRYWRGTAAIPGNYVSVSMWESQEAVALQYTSYTGTTSAVVMGALFDPLSYQSGISCETDGRLYYMFGTGSTAGMAATWLGGAGGAGDNGVLGYHSTVVNQYHAGYFLPGTNTVSTTARFGSFVPTLALLSTNGALPMIPWSIRDLTSGNFLGQSRNFYMIRDGTSLYEPRQGAVRSGTALASTTSGVTDTMIFMR
jgi:hypothetical protein